MNNQIPTEKELEEIEKNYDPQLSFRKLGVKLEVLVSLLLVLFKSSFLFQPNNKKTKANTNEI